MTYWRQTAPCNLWKLQHMCLQNLDSHGGCPQHPFPSCLKVSDADLTRLGIGDSLLCVASGVAKRLAHVIVSQQQDADKKLEAGEMELLYRHTDGDVLAATIAASKEVLWDCVSMKPAGANLCAPSIQQPLRPVVS